MSTIRLKTELQNRPGPDRDGRVDAARVQAAIDAASAEGGGLVVLEPGEWVCSSIFMRSHVELHLERGCRLVADTDLTHYTPVPHHAGNKDQSRLLQIEQWFPGTMERVVFSNITGKTFPDEGIANERPIYVDIQQWTRPEPVLGHIRDLVFQNILCETRGRMVFTAQDGTCIENVVLDNVILRIPEIEDPAVSVPSANSMQLSNFNPHTRAARAALVADNVHGLLARDVQVHWPRNPDVSMDAVCLRRCRNMQIESPELKPIGADGVELREIT